VGLQRRDLGARGAEGRQPVRPLLHDERPDRPRGLGPFHDDSSKPLVEALPLGGAIDASPFRDDDGKLYLYWKNDGNAVNQPTRIWVQRLSADGLRVDGPRIDTGEVNDQVWEANVVEAPMMWKHDGRYYLFYSGNDYASDGYAVGYATCKGPLGPCVDAPENPILATKCRAHGPGHNAIVEVDGQDWIVYHAWRRLHAGDKRELWISRLDWRDGKPVVQSPCGS
jgi:beta-xylosidase